MRLNDVHVRCDAQGSQPFWHVARCLSRLYDVRSIPKAEREALDFHEAFLQFD